MIFCHRLKGLKDFHIRLFIKNFATNFHEFFFINLEHKNWRKLEKIVGIRGKKIYTAI